MRRLERILDSNNFRIEELGCILYLHNVIVCVYTCVYGWFLCDGRHWWGWMAAWRAGSSRLVLDQSVYVMLSTVFRCWYFEHICCTQ